MKRITISMDVVTALVLFHVLRQIGGDPTRTPRGRTDAVERRLKEILEAHVVDPLNWSAKCHRHEVYRDAAHMKLTEEWPKPSLKYDHPLSGEIVVE